MSGRVMRALPKDTREMIIGGAVLLTLAAALWSNTANRGAGSGPAGGYRLEAVFQRADGLTRGAQVRVAGIPVGQVVSQRLDARYRAHVTVWLGKGIVLPRDSAAVIETDGLLGAKYIELQPGGAADFLPPGGRIEYTQGALILEGLLEKIIDMAETRRSRPPSVPPSHEDPGTGPLDSGVPSFDDQ